MFLGDGRGWDQSCQKLILRCCDKSIRQRAKGSIQQVINLVIILENIFMIDARFWSRMWMVCLPQSSDFLP